MLLAAAKLSVMHEPQEHSALSLLQAPSSLHSEQQARSVGLTAASITETRG